MIIRNIKCDNIDLEVQHEIPFLLIWIISPFVLLYYTILYTVYYIMCGLLNHGIVTTYCTNTTQKMDYHFETTTTSPERNSV